MLILMQIQYTLLNKTTNHKELNKHKKKMLLKYSI